MPCPTTSWFLGSASPTGYLTHFDELISSGSYHCYIIKGAPGYGKAELLRRVASCFSETEDAIEELYCSNDTSQLDAVVLHRAGVIVVDGAPPHAFESTCPGVCQSLVSLEDCWDLEKLRALRAEIMRSYEDAQRAQARAKRFLSAFASLNCDTCTLALEGLNRRKLSAFAARLCHRLAPHRGEETGASSYRQLSAVTPDGYKTMTETIAACDTVYVLSDGLFAAADLLLCELTACAIRRGLDVIISESPLFSTRLQEHLLLPQLKTAFVTSNHINRLSFPNAHVINCTRFFDKAQLARKKQRIAFNKKAGMDLFDEAVLSLRHAKDAYDELGHWYGSATDFDKMEAEAKALCEKITPRKPE